MKCKTRCDRYITSQYGGGQDRKTLVLGDRSHTDGGPPLTRSLVAVAHIIPNPRRFGEKAEREREGEEGLIEKGEGLSVGGGVWLGLYTRTLDNLV